MAEKLEALRELLAQVETGELMEVASEAFGTPPLHEWRKTVDDAYKGSLDAAKALHEAVLPGWGWHIRQDEDGSYASCMIAPHYWVTPGCMTDPDPARAWLAAILKALISDEEA